jgi:hypothetical protein
VIKSRLATCLDEIRMEALAGRRDPAPGAPDRAFQEIVRLAEVCSRLAAHYADRDELANREN